MPVCLPACVPRNPCACDFPSDAISALWHRPSLESHPPTTSTSTTPSSIRSQHITTRAGGYMLTICWPRPRDNESDRTILDREPKIGNRHIDLLRLYTRVNAEGGYDQVSDTKGNKLAWRRIASEFLPVSPNLTTQAFLVKSIYYKNLACARLLFSRIAPVADAPLAGPTRSPQFTNAILPPRRYSRTSLLKAVAFSAAP